MVSWGLKRALRSFEESGASTVYGIHIMDLRPVRSDDNVESVIGARESAHRSLSTQCPTFPTQDPHSSVLCKEILTRVFVNKDILTSHPPPVNVLFKFSNFEGESHQR